MKRLSKITNIEAILLLLSAVVFTFVLFYIDEGAYTINWIQQTGSWILFVVFCLGIFLSQLIYLLIVFINSARVKRFIISSLLGFSTFIGFIFILHYVGT